MRRSLLALLVELAVLLTSICPAYAQTSVVTDPLGFTTRSLLGSSDTFVSIPFTRAPEFAGAISAASGNTITVAGAPWTAHQFFYVAGTQPKHYYALIGPITGTNTKEGHTYAVTDNGINTLTVDTTHDELNNIPANTQVTLIPYWTPATVFPSSDANVSFTPTASPPSYKTLIRVPDYSASGINLPYLAEYYFGNNAWRRVTNDADASDDPLPPAPYFVVRNANGAPTLPLISLGAVLTKKLALPLTTSMGQSQDNPVGLVRPFDVALNAIGLGPADTSFVSGDQLLLFDNSQVAFDKMPSATYTYDTSSGGGWRLNGDTTTDHGSDLIPTGTGFIVRKGAASGQTVFWTNAPLMALHAISRKTHGATPFGIDLPLSGLGIECRTGGPTEVVFTFPRAVTFNTTAGTQGASVTSGTGSVTSTSGSGTTAVTVNLTGVTTAQKITLTLFGVNDGTFTNDAAVRMGVLVGDVNGDGGASNLDVSLVKAKVAAGAMVDSSNFRDDVNADGGFSNLDVSITKAQVAAGAALPP